MAAIARLRTGTTVAVYLLALSGCASMWFEGTVHHREESDFGALGGDIEDWKSDWRLLSDQYAHNGRSIMLALRDRDATCGQSNISLEGSDEPAYKCGYVFCKGGIYQLVDWLFPQGFVAQDAVRLSYSNMNLQTVVACQGGGNGRQMRGLQKFHICSASTGEDCTGYLQEQTCKDGWCSPVTRDVDRPLISSPSNHREAGI